MSKPKLAIISTHPIQYNAPLFRMLTVRDRIRTKVFYTWGKEAIENKFDPGFNRVVQWDIPLTEGYEFEFPENVAAEKGSHHFHGIKNPALISEIDHFDPDAILVFGWSFHSHLKILRHYKGKKPVIFRGDSTLLDERSGVKSLLRQIFLKRVYRHVDFALYTGKNNYDYYRKMGLKDRQLVHAPHAIDNERFAGSDEERDALAVEIRISLGISKDSFVFLFAGKIEEKKNVVGLLEAFAQPAVSGNTHLVIVGNGPLENGIKKKSEGIANVHFMDFQNQQQMPVIYRLADVFVLPSKGPGETWGLALNEAMASGRAVLVSDKTGGAVDLVDAGRNGYIFKAGDIGDLVSKMKKMTGMGKTEMAKWGQHSRERIKDFSFNRFCEETEKLALRKYSHTA